MPQVLLRFLDMLEDDQASLTDLATLAGRDPALAARFLTAANSPALRRGPDVTSLDDCLATLGTRLARTIAECLAIESGFARSGGEQEEVDVEGIWRHSLRVAEMARALAIRTNYGDSERAYLAGLLHDIGQLLLLGGVGERYGCWLQNFNVESKLRDVEELLFGTDHAAIGAWLVDQWRLSSFLSDAILFHHKRHDEIEDADQLSKIVWSSHVIDSCGEGSGLSGGEDLAAVISMLGLEPSEILAIRKQAGEQVAVLSATLGAPQREEGSPLPFPAPPENRQPRPQHDRGHDSAHSEVELRVRDMAIMQSLQRNLSTLCREEEILVAVHESARILFGIGRVAFFFIAQDEAVASAPDFAGQPALLKHLQIRLDTGRSLAAAAMVGKQPRSTFDKELPVPVSLVDVQVARALESEGVLFVPMCIRERRIGVMACGINLSQHARLQKFLPRMARFAQQAAVSIEAWRGIRAKEERIAASLCSGYQQHARKIVHETGNPLGIIKNYLTIVGQKLPADNSAGQELEILREEVDRVAQILQRLHDLNAPMPATESVDLNGMIDGMLALYGETLFASQGIVVEKELSPSLLPITGSRDSIKQVLLNLWTNAADALSTGDRLLISTSDNVILNGRFYVEICLSDTGPGLPPEVMQRLFQPLDSRQRPGHSGIGLSIVASLVEGLDGLIKCRSNVGNGTSFFILLPREMENEVAASW
ncbi:hypothetical protein GMSM_28220 [Geomonas sp. Red276]